MCIYQGRITSVKRARSRDKKYCASFAIPIPSDIMPCKMRQFQFKNPPAITEKFVPQKRKTEQSLQLQVCRYLDLKFPNAIYRSDFASGLHLSPFQAKIHKAMQSGRAWLDLFIYEPS